ncbi:hypothetical protein Tco_1342169, partial [Tanacetum coccineum]
MVAAAMVGDGDGGCVGGSSDWSGYGDLVDPLMRITFDLGQNTRRKTFPVAVGQKRWWPEVAAGWGGREKWERMKM